MLMMGINVGMLECWIIGFQVGMMGMNVDGC